MEPDPKDLIKITQYSSKILEIVNDAEEMTQSDLQGCIDAIVITIINDTRKGLL